MAINYTNLFTDMGKMLKYLNTYITLGKTTLPADFTAIAGVLTTNGRYDVLSGMSEMYEGLQDSAIGWADQVGLRIQNRLQHESTVVSQLPISARGNLQNLLKELRIDMIANTKTVQKNTVTLGTPTANGTNVGDATLIASKVLDGYNEPRSGFAANPGYAGVDSELGVTSETITVTCTQDSENGGTEGSETWSVNGAIPGQSDFDWRSEGSGEGIGLTTGNGRGLIENGEFEDFATTNTPDSWTIAAGAVTTNILEDAVDFKRGTSSLKLKGNGVAASIKLTQAPTTDLNPLRAYWIAAWIKGDNTIAGTSALTIQFEGTGYTAGSTEKISLNQAALAALTSWGLYSALVVMPATLPSDFLLTINASGTLTNNALIRIDGLCLMEATYHGGVALGMVAGATPALIRDRYTVTVANNNTGVFQTYARKNLKVQLYSSGSPSISDSLAT